MARSPRIDIKENYYHLLNRANARLKIFFTEEDFEMFEQVLEDAWEIFQMKIIVYCVMPNHFHLVVKTQNNGELAQMMKWITQTHTSRWHLKNNTVGTGSLYQGRYKSFIIQDELYLRTIIRYVERNPLTANLVTDPLEWKYSSLYRRHKGSEKDKRILAEWPFEEDKDYLDNLIQPLTNKEIEKIELSENKNVPFGDDDYDQEIENNFKNNN
jgi:putative transposase